MLRSSATASTVSCTGISSSRVTTWTAQAGDFSSEVTESAWWRIGPTRPDGPRLTTGKDDVGYGVTGYGGAHLRGRSARERARALVEIAHPDFRDELTERAKDLHLR